MDIDPFDHDNRQLDREAANLLLGMMGNAPSYRHIPGPVLQWYHRRRSLDLQMYDAKGGLCGGEMIRQRQAIVADLEVIEFALQEQLKERTQ